MSLILGWSLNQCTFSYFHAKDQLLWILKTYSLFNLNPSNCELQIKESGVSFQQYCKSCNSLEILPKRACELMIYLLRNDNYSILYRVTVMLSVSM